MKSAKSNCGSILNSITLSQDMILIAGREILKVYRRTKGDFEVVHNLKSLQKQPQMICTDAAWMRNNVVVSLQTGSIHLYDLNKMGTEKLDRVFQEHQRAVHRLAFHPHDPFLFISASQDSTIKLWDLRTGGKSRHTFEGKAESARDCQFNPVAPFEFAAVFDNGSLQVWDIRNPSNFERKWSAHNGLALCLDYNFTGSLISTGGRDRAVKVWDLKSSNRKPYCNIQTIASVSRVKWRPGFETQIAACSLANDNRIHIWDMKRPFVSTLCLDNHDNSVTGIQWQNDSVLYSCSKDESFIQNDLSDGYKPAELLTSNVCTWDSYGGIGFALWPTDNDEFDDISDYAPSPMKSSPGNFLIKQDFKSSSVLVPVVPQQIFGILNAEESFDYPSFAYLAHNYIADSNDIKFACSENANHALKMEKSEMAAAWKLIALVFGGEKLPVRNISKEFRESISGASISQAKRVFSFFKEVFSAGMKTEDQALPYPAIIDSTIVPGMEMFKNDQTSSSSSDSDSGGLNLKPKLKSFGSALNISSSPKLPKTRNSRISAVSSEKYFPEGEPQTSPTESSMPEIDALDPPWSPDDLVFRLLDYFAEEGNVQMNIFICRTLEKHIKFPKDTILQYTQSYLDLLWKFQLWSEAAELIKVSHLESISALNQNATTIHRCCYNCGNPIPVTFGKHSSHCDNCKKLIGACALCHEPVKDLYTWCQHCSHGGHLHCFDDWFVDYSFCPSGCGHNCVSSLNPAQT